MNLILDNPSIELAKQRLEAALKRILGQELRGVTGYGARWDKDTGTIALGVLVDEHQDTEMLRQALPSTINDMPVQVSHRPPAKAQYSPILTSAIS